jgi:thiosulfate/3-mercaptopyruvate sulfurtransferase
MKVFPAAHPRKEFAMVDTTLLSPEALAQMMALDAPLVIIDTRSPEEYAQGHLPGAINMREIFTFLATSDPEGLLALREKFATAFGAAGLSGKELAVIYEDAMNTGYGQSCRGYYLLKTLGYPHAAILHGGLKAWVAAGLPLVTEVPVPKPAQFPMPEQLAATMITQQDMLDALDDSEIIKLDVRDRDEWMGESSSPYGKDFCPRMGRIPGAVWIEWYRLMDPDLSPPLFRPKAAILAACREVGITPDSEIYLYCFKGARASNTFVALQEAGIKNVKIYFGSWNEWSRDLSLPIEEGAPSEKRMADAA